MARLGSAATGAPRRFVRYSRTNRIPAALLLFGLALGLAVLRRGRRLAAREVAGWLVAAVIVVLLASVFPELVVAFLAAALLGLAITDSALVTDIAARLGSLLNVTGGPVFDRPVGAPGGAGVHPR